MDKLKLYVFNCDYEHTMDDCSVIALTKEDAIKFLSDTVEYNPDDWAVEEFEIKEGMIL
jgi:hypothetical protein